METTTARKPRIEKNCYEFRAVYPETTRIFYINAVSVEKAWVKIVADVMKQGYSVAMMKQLELVRAIY